MQLAKRHLAKYKCGSMCIFVPTCITLTPCRWEKIKNKLGLVFTSCWRCMLHDHSTLEKRIVQSLKSIKSSKWACHSWPWWVYLTTAAIKVIGGKYVPFGMGIILLATKRHCHFKAQLYYTLKKTSEIILPFFFSKRLNLIDYSI